MGKAFFLLFIAILGWGCQNAPASKAPAPMTYDQLVAKEMAKGATNDTTFLGFVLGCSEQAAKRHLKELALEGKVGALSTWSFPFATLDGYPYELPIGAGVGCALGDSYFASKLLSIKLLVLGECSGDSLKSFLNSRYGNADFVDLKNDNIFWLDGNKEVSLKLDAFKVIAFTDLRLKIEKAGLEAKIDSLQRANRADRKTDFK